MHVHVIRFNVMTIYTDRRTNILIKHRRGSPIHLYWFGQDTNRFDCPKMRTVLCRETGQAQGGSIIRNSLVNVHAYKLTTSLAYKQKLT